MAESKLPFVEGASIHRPPMFSGVNNQFWKVKMKIFIESIDRGIWNAIVNGPYIPMSVVNGVSVEKSYDELSEAENKRVQYDCVVKMNFSEYLSVARLKRCGTYLRSHMKELLM